ncbi:MAG: hypothetical protein AB8G14_15790 [Ilumatobacter sp.]
MSSRSVATAAFDRFVFETVAERSGVTIECGIDANRAMILTSSATIDDLPSTWLALQSRAGDDLLELHQDEQLGSIHQDQTASAQSSHASAGFEPGLDDGFDDGFSRTFAIDVDDHDVVRSLLGPVARSELIALERRAGPLVIIVDPGERLDTTTSLIVARRVAADTGPTSIDVSAAFDMAAGVAAALS